jgi:uncharacterized protein YcbK (DUF882 family)
MRTRSPRELAILDGLTPHTRAHVQQLLAEQPLLTITSGRRSRLQNARVGGSRTSWHLKGRAVDFVGPTWDLVRAAGTAWALRVGAGCTGPEEVLLEDLGEDNQHLHVAW